MSTVGFLKVLSSNNITWNNIDLPAEVKQSIVKELVAVDANSVQVSKDEAPTKLTITFMTSPQCSLCTIAKAVIAAVNAQVISVERI